MVGGTIKNYPGKKCAIGKELLGGAKQSIYLSHLGVHYVVVLAVTNIVRTNEFQSNL